jgi:hypothetical protein
LVEMVTGSSLTATPFLTYLKRKLRDTALLSP